MLLSVFRIEPSRQESLVIVGKQVSPLAKAFDTHRACGPGFSASRILDISELEHDGLGPAENPGVGFVRLGCDQIEN